MFIDFSRYLQEREERINRWIFESPAVSDRFYYNPSTGKIYLEMAVEKVEMPDGEVVYNFDKKSYPITFDTEDCFYLYQFAPQHWAAALSARYNQLIFDYDIFVKQRYIMDVLSRTAGRQILGDPEVEQWIRTEDESSMPKWLHQAVGSANKIMEDKKNDQNLRDPNVFAQPVTLESTLGPENRNINLQVDFTKSGRVDRERWSVADAIRQMDFNKILISKGFDPSVWSMVRIHDRGIVGKRGAAKGDYSDREQKLASQRWYLVKAYMGHLHDRITRPTADEVIARYGGDLDSRMSYLYAQDKEGTMQYDKYKRPIRANGAIGLNLSTMSAVYMDKKRNKTNIRTPEDYLQTTQDVQRAGVAYLGMSSETARIHLHEWMRRINDGWFFADEQELGVAGRDVPEDEKIKVLEERMRQAKDNTELQRLLNTIDKTEYGADRSAVVNFGGGPPKEEPRSYDFSMLQGAWRPGRDIAQPQREKQSKNYLVMGPDALDKINKYCNEGRPEALYAYFEALKEAEKYYPEELARLHPLDIWGSQAKLTLTSINVNDLANQMMFGVDSGTKERRIPRLKFNRGAVNVEAPSTPLSGKKLGIPTPLLVPSATTDNKMYQKWQHYSRMRRFLSDVINLGSPEQKALLCRRLKRPEELKELFAQYKQKWDSLPEEAKRKETGAGPAYKEGMQLAQELLTIHEKWIMPKAEQVAERGREISDQEILSIAANLVPQYQRRAVRTQNEAPLWDDYDWLLSTSHPTYHSIFNRRWHMGAPALLKQTKTQIGGKREHWDLLKNYLGYHGPTLNHPDFSEERMLKTNKFGYKNDPLHFVSAFAQMPDEQLSQEIDKLEQELEQARDLHDTQRAKALESKVRRLRSFSALGLDKEMVKLLIQLKEDGEEFRTMSYEFSRQAVEHIKVVRRRRRAVQKRVQKGIEGAENQLNLIAEVILKRKLEAKQVIKDAIAKTKDEAVLYQNLLKTINERLKSENRQASAPEAEQQQYLQDQFEYLKSAVIPGLRQTYSTIAGILKGGSRMPQTPAKEWVIWSEARAERDISAEEERSGGELATLRSRVRLLTRRVTSLMDQISALSKTRQKPHVGHYFDSGFTIPDGPILGSIKQFLKPKLMNGEPEAEVLWDRIEDVYAAVEEQVKRNLGRGAYPEFVRALQGGDESQKLRSGYDAWKETKRITRSYLGSIYEQDYGWGTKRKRRKSGQPAKKEDRVFRKLLSEQRDREKSLNDIITGLTGHDVNQVQKNFYELQIKLEQILAEVRAAAQETEMEKQRIRQEAEKLAGDVVGKLQNEEIDSPKAKHLAARLVRSVELYSFWKEIYGDLGFTGNDLQEIAKHAYAHHESVNPIVDYAKDLENVLAKVKEEYARAQQIADPQERLRAMNEIASQLPRAFDHSKDPSAFRREQIVRIMKNVAHQAETGRIPNVVGLNDFRQGETPPYNWELMKRFQQLVAKNRATNAHPELRQKFEDQELDPFLRDLHNRQTTDEEHTNINTRMVADYVLSYFLRSGTPPDRAPVFYTFQPIEVQAEKLVVPATLRTTKEQYAFLRVNDDANVLQNEAWFKLLSDQNVHQEIVFKTAACPVFRASIHKMIWSGVVNYREPKRYWIVQFRLSPQVLNLLRTYYQESRNIQQNNAQPQSCVYSIPPSMDCNNKSCYYHSQQPGGQWDLSHNPMFDPHSLRPELFQKSREVSPFENQPQAQPHFTV